MFHSSYRAEDGERYKIDARCCSTQVQLLCTLFCVDLFAVAAFYGHSVAALGVTCSWLLLTTFVVAVCPV